MHFVHNSPTKYFVNFRHCGSVMLMRRPIRSLWTSSAWICGRGEWVSSTNWRCAISSDTWSPWIYWTSSHTCRCSWWSTSLWWRTHWTWAGISESGSCKHIIHSLWQLKCVQKFPCNPFIFGFCIDAKIEAGCLCVIQTPNSWKHKPGHLNFLAKDF